MSITIADKFAELGIDNAPGQEARKQDTELDIRGERIDGPAVDFSHGDVDAFTPTPGSLEAFVRGVETGGAQAYTEYRGKKCIIADLAKKLSDFTGARIDPENGLILTPGTQGALFLAAGASIMPGDGVAFVEPDYFANRKLVRFFEAKPYPVPMRYMECARGAGLDMEALEESFQEGVKLFLFSTPNNPTGAIYSQEEIRTIARLAKRYGVALIVDELYARQVFDGRTYTHLLAQNNLPDALVTIMGPSKTESLSGYRLGAAFGTPEIILRMEKLQAIMALRCSGYNQAVFSTWFDEPEGWVSERVRQHQDIRDAILERIRKNPGVWARPTEGGSYLFVTMPALDVSLHDFVKIVKKLANVAITPGTEFGPQFLDSFRINFSQDKDKALSAMDRVMQIMERYRK